MKRVLNITKVDPHERGCDQASHLTGDQRVLSLEALRREVSKVTNREYPQRLRRVLEVVKRREG